MFRSMVVCTCDEHGVDGTHEAAIRLGEAAACRLQRRRCARFGEVVVSSRPVNETSSPKTSRREYRVRNAPHSLIQALAPLETSLPIARKRLGATLEVRRTASVLMTVLTDTRSALTPATGRWRGVRRDDVGREKMECAARSAASVNSTSALYSIRREFYQGYLGF